MTYNDHAARCQERRAVYAAKAEAGICRWCTSPAMANRVLCPRHVEMSRASWRKRCGIARKAIAACAIAFCALASPRTAGADSKPQDGAANASAGVAVSAACQWPVNGAADGEALEDRIQRLRVALRLSEAERAVARKRGRK